MPSLVFASTLSPVSHAPAGLESRSAYLERLNCNVSSKLNRIQQLFLKIIYVTLNFIGHLF